MDPSALCGVAEAAATGQVSTRRKEIGRETGRERCVLFGPPVFSEAALSFIRSALLLP